jgi:hypothetical protein
MNRLRHSARLTLQVGAALLACRAANASLESQWRASSGLLPDQACPPWSLTDSATPEDPVLAGGHLTIATSADAETIAYGHSGLTLQIPDPLIIEFRARFVSGSQSIDSRAPLTVHFTIAPDIGNGLYVRSGQIFLNADNNVRGPTAAVDTSSFHTYRIEVSAAGGIVVDYDSVPTLTGAVFNSDPHNGPTPRVLWGEGSTFAFGTSEWEFFRHNIHLADCDVDGDGFLAAVDCEDLDPCTHPGAPETCDGIDNDCDALTDDALAPPPGVIHGLRVAADAASITWGLCEARRYDVVRGSLGALRTSAGNFATAVSLCVEDDSPDSAASDPTPVPAGTLGFFYLVRGDGTCGPGSYNNGLASQIGSRDAEIAASGFDCP